MSPRPRESRASWRRRVETPVTQPKGPPATTIDACPTPQKVTQIAAEVPTFSLVDQDVNSTPAEYKCQGHDWFAIFNKHVPRKLDVSILHTLEHDSAVCCVSISVDGKYIATGCDRTAQIFDVQTGQKAVTLNDNLAECEGLCYIRSVRFSPDGQYLATGAEDQLIRICDIANKKIVNRLKGHKGDIYTLDFTGDGTRLASGSNDNTARLWDMKTGECLYTFPLWTCVAAVTVSANGKFLAAGSTNGAVAVWDTEMHALFTFLEAHDDGVFSVVFGPGGHELLSGSLDKTIKLWELNGLRPLSISGCSSRGVCKTTFKGHKDYVISVALSSDGQWIVSGSKDRTVQFWDPKDGQPQFMLQGHGNSGIRSPFPRASFVVCFLFLLFAFLFCLLRQLTRF
jgi:general transcriptional corepressor TUP1